MRYAASRGQPVRAGDSRELEGFGLPGNENRSRFPVSAPRFERDQETESPMNHQGLNGPDAIDPELARFVGLFRDGRYWDSHEALETAWRRNDSRFYKGLILYASAFVHVGRHNAHGVRAQLRKTVHHLTPYAPSYLGFDVAAILRHAHQCLDRLSGGDCLNELSLPVLDWQPGHVRGDESELGPLQDP